MFLMLDHVVVLVTDLDAASADFGALGFTVVPGGTHTDGATHNALIAFADGCYIELIAFLREAPQHRWWRHTAHGAGLIDFALLPDDIEADMDAARTRGLDLSGPVDGGRLRGDGVQLHWQSGTGATDDLPFLCYDVTPRALRVPHDADAQHANGARGVAGLSVVVHDLMRSSARYQALLGFDPQPQPAPADETLAARTAGFVLRDAAIGLVAPAPLGENPEYQRLTQRGQGPFALGLRGSVDAPTLLDPTRTHGVPILVR